MSRMSMAEEREGETEQKSCIKRRKLKVDGYRLHRRSEGIYGHIILIRLEIARICGNI